MSGKDKKTFNIKKFDMKNIKDGSTILFIGRRGTGKSTLVADMFRHHTNWPVGVVISGTERANHFFEKFIPKMLIYDEFEPGILDRFIERQEKITNQCTNEMKKFGRSDIDPRAFMILDDCLYDKSWPNDKNIRCLFMNGRHYNITFAITMQFPLGIPPVLRANVDYVFILRDNMIKNRERIYQQYAGMFPTFESFSQVLNQTTNNYECLVIDNKTQSNKLEDQVYWYKADTSMGFKVCSPDLWRMQDIEDEKKAYAGLNDDDDEQEEPWDPVVQKNKKNTQLINVRKV